MARYNRTNYRNNSRNEQSLHVAELVENNEGLEQQSATEIKDTLINDTTHLDDLTEIETFSDRRTTPQKKREEKPVEKKVEKKVESKVEEEAQRRLNQNLMNQRMAERKKANETILHEKIASEERRNQEMIQQEKMRLERQREENAQRERMNQRRMEEERMRRERENQQRMEEERMRRERENQQRMEEERRRRERENQQRMQEEMRQQMTEQQKMQEEKIRKEMMNQQRAQEENMRQEMMNQQRSNEEKMRQQMMEQKNMCEEKLHEERMNQEKLREEMMRQERTNNQRMLEEKLRQERESHENLCGEKMRKEMMNQKMMWEEKMRMEMMNQNKMCEEKLNRGMEKQEESCEDILRRRRMNHPCMQKEMYPHKHMEKKTCARNEVLDSREMDSYHSCKKVTPVGCENTLYEDNLCDKRHSTVINHVRVRILHAAVGFEPIFVVIGNRPLVDGLGFGKISAYDRIADGFGTVMVYHQSSKERPICTAVIPFMAGTRVTLAVVNSVRGVQVIQIPDDTCTGRTSDRATFRVANLTFDDGPFDVTLSDGTLVFSDVNVKEVTVLKQALAGDYDFYVSGTPVNLMNSSNTNLQNMQYNQDEVTPQFNFYQRIVPDKMYTACIIGGYNTSSPLQVLVIEN